MKPGIVVMTEEPVPNVALPSPLPKAPCPKSAAWESPMAEAMGRPSGRPLTLLTVPKSDA
jgi:hypothetical protein